MAKETDWKVIFVEGLILMALGILAIVISPIFTFGVEGFIGVLLVIAGIVIGYRALVGRGLPGTFLWLVLGILAVVAGVLLLVYPVAGIKVITIILAIFFLADGITKIALALSSRKSKFWAWYLFSGIVSLVLALVIWIGWPNSSYWLLGLLVGINLILWGAGRAILAWQMRRP